MVIRTCSNCDKMNVCKYKEQVENIVKDVDDNYNNSSLPISFTVSCKEFRECNHIKGSGIR